MAKIELPAHVVATVNQDRYMKCASCRTTADYLIQNNEAVITTIRPGAEPTSQWVDGEQVFRDDVRTEVGMISTCKRHAALNAKRAIEMRSLTRTWDQDNRRWIEEKH
jgi:hypothetical protein